MSYAFINRKYFDDYIGYTHKLSPLTKNEIEDSSINNEIYDDDLEWEKLDNIYFKRSAVFYFVEESLLTALYLADGKHAYDIDLTAYFKNNNHYNLKIKSNDIKILNVKNLFWFEINVTDNFFKFQSNLLQRMLISFTDKSNVTTLNPINVKIKHKIQEKKGNLICTKCYQLSQDQIPDLMWWIELNKELGYDIVYCNNSLQYDKNFELFLNERKNFIKVVQMSYFPYFYNKSSIYLNEFEEISKYLKYSNGKMSFTHQRNSYELIQYNECYHDNKNKYKHIAIIDIDETVIPFNREATDRVKYINSLNIDECHDFNCLSKRIDICNSTGTEKIDQYINRIETEQIGILFSPGYYLTADTMKIILNRLNDFIKNYTMSELINNSIFLIVKEPNNRFNITFKFKSYDEIIYIQKITQIFNALVNEKSLKINKTIVSSNFLDRFFYYASEGTFKNSFKTFHNTKYIKRVGNHEAMHFPKNSSIKVPYYNGHLSHFRISYSNIFQYVSGQNFTIYASDFGFDINYLMCHYPKILKTIQTTTVDANNN